MDGLFPAESVAKLDRPAGPWGDWRLGDLTDALSRVTEVFGPATPANWVMTAAPSIGDEDAPSVQLVVNHRATIEWMLAALAKGGYAVRYLDDPGQVTDRLTVQVCGVFVAAWVGTGGQL